MAIWFFPNDPEVADVLPPRLLAPRPEPAADRPRFAYANASPEGTYRPPAPEFVFWQCREAALAAVETAETLGWSPDHWARAGGDARTLGLVADAGMDLNAYYDGQAVRFFHYGLPPTIVFAGASTDIVAHETGHALLDAIRPDLWEINTVEVASFHEAFADGIAILTALSDRETRAYLVPRLDQPNGVEALAESLSLAIRRVFGPSHPASEPRHALNGFRWTMPSVLPASGLPETLTNESHSFSRVFTACLYDLIRNLYASASGQDEAALETAARTAGRLLIEGVRTAPASVRFFQQVGTAMLAADETLFDGAHDAEIRSAFEAHGLVLESRSRSVAAVNLESTSPDEPLSPAGVDLSDLDPRLRNCLAFASGLAPPGHSGTTWALAAVRPESTGSEDEVRTFVAALLAHDRIDFEENERARDRFEAVGSPGPSARTTHAVRMRDGRKVLTRVRFL